MYSSKTNLVRPVLVALLILITPFTLLSQTGPGGVGDASSNVIWLDASQIVLNDTDPVPTWPDRSGNGNDFTQGDGTLQPTFRTGVLGGQPVVDFNRDRLVSGAIPALNTSDFSQFMVTRADNNTHLGFVLESAYTSGGDPNADEFWGTYMTTATNAFEMFTRNTSGGPVGVNIGYSTGYNILSSVISSGDGDINGYFNNGGLVTNAGTIATGVDHLRTVVGGKSTLYKSFYFGNIAEIVVYNIAVNSAQHNIVNNYLAAKYVRVISNDYYAHSAHRYEMFGVGQEADGGNTTAQGSGIVEFSAPVLANGDYILSGHDNALIAASNNDVPASIAPASRLQRVWRVTTTGTPGTLTVSFDVSGTVYAAESTFHMVVENANGIFNDGGTTDYGPAVKVGNIVTFAGVTLGDNDYFSLFGPADGIESITDGNWSSGSTWNCSCVPGSTDDATIKATHTVTLDANSSINDLTIEATGALDYSPSRRLDVFGDVAVAGSITTMVASNGRIHFKGAGTQTFTNTGATIDINNLYATGGSTVELYTGSFDVYNSLYVSSGQLSNVSGIITLISDATATAGIQTGASNAFSGNFVIQRYISTRNASWGDLSSPVAAATLGSWDSNQSGTVTEIIMSNVNGIDGAAGQFFSAWEYDRIAQKYDSIPDTTYVLSPGAGVEIWLEDVASTWNAKAFDTHGVPNSGDVVEPVRSGWNLVGNPYACRIGWTGLTKPTLDGTFYIWNTNNGSYDAFTNANISSHQGFWVFSNSNGNLTFTESSKTFSTTSNFLRTSGSLAQEPLPQLHDYTQVKLKIQSNINTYSNEVKLRMNNLALGTFEAFDGRFKASRIEEAPSITSNSTNSNVALAINSFNYEDEVVIPVAVTVGISGKYYIEPINFDAFSDDYEFIELKDNKTGKVYNLSLKTKGNIAFDINKGDDPDRFTLRLSNLFGQSSEGVDNNVTIYKSTEFTIVEFDNMEENYEISVYNTVGQKVIESIYSVNKNRVVISNTNLPKGMNIITVKSSQSNTVKKLIY